ncbi:hypothetical protein [Halobacillus sp. A5]|uniref:hypothetical protein n=1 Tax=Halobacillus sp. A5 TaxID=2880263 RepID=UPI0020A66EFE|nr:hypothetical protein [Halobacillus sp. A5]MCP3025694.1 hypothetical protein [Halobacillus sp. A5]
MSIKEDNPYTSGASFTLPHGEAKFSCELLEEYDYKCRWHITIDSGQTKIFYRKYSVKADAV